MICTLNQYLKYLEEQKRDLKEEIKTIKKTLKIIPNIKKRNNFFYSNEANKRVDSFFIKKEINYHSMWVLAVRPYINIEGYIIYSEPAVFDIGELNSVSAKYVLYSDWEKIFKKAEIGQIVIKKVKKYIRTYSF